MCLRGKGSRIYSLPEIKNRDALKHFLANKARQIISGKAVANMLASINLCLLKSHSPAATESEVAPPS
jgi:hypothetical protein